MTDAPQSFPSQAAADLFARRGTFAALCADTAAARTEIERLLAGIAGFEGCTIVSIERLVEGEDASDMGWTAKIDDPSDEYEYHLFTIFDNGDMDWD